MKKLIASTFISCLPLFCAIVCMYGIVYIALQQYIRLSADAVPMQYAADIKARLESGVSLRQAIRGIDSTDMQTSLAPFAMICDHKGDLKIATTNLHGRSIVPPAGVFTVAGQNGENRRSWQPEAGVRNAIVVLPYSINGDQGYVVAGHSLKETEKREQFLMGQIVVGILITLGATFIIAILTAASVRTRSIPAI